MEYQFTPNGRHDQRENPSDGRTRSPRGRKAFGTTEEFAKATKALAANQGLYNGFLAAGLIWGIALGDAGRAVEIFFLSCIVVAGLFGAATANKKILFIQAIPAGLALTLVLLSVR